MGNILKLEAKTRKKEEKPNLLRKSGIVPAVLYGPGKENENLSVDRISLEKLFAVVGESNIFELSIDGKVGVKTIVKHVDREPVKGDFSHVDFFQVDMSKKITVEIPLQFVGEAKAIKDFGGTLVKAINHFEIECLPSELVDHIDIDISSLANLGDSLYVRDIVLPAGFRVINVHGDDMIISAVAVAAEEVAPATPEAVVEEKPEEKKK